MEKKALDRQALLDFCSSSLSQRTNHLQTSVLPLYSKRKRKERKTFDLPHIVIVYYYTIVYILDVHRYTSYRYTSRMYTIQK